jgi:hypothetical protein
MELELVMERQRQQAEQAEQAGTTRMGWQRARTCRIRGMEHCCSPRR